MATAESTAAPRFTRSWRAVGGFELALVCEDSAGAVLEWVEIDIRTLPDRPDLLDRMRDPARGRLVADAVAARTP